MATGSLIDDELLSSFHALSRTPFRIRLAKLHGIPLHPAKLEAWANRFPDKLAQAEAIYARLAGFTDKQEVTITGLVGFAAKLQGMSDAEAEAMLMQQAQQAMQAQQPAMLGTGVTLSPSTPTPKAPALASGTSTPPPPVVPGAPHAV